MCLRRHTRASSDVVFDVSSSCFFKLWTCFLDKTQIDTINHCIGRGKPPDVSEYLSEWPSTDAHFTAFFLEYCRADPEHVGSFSQGSMEMLRQIFKCDVRKGSSIGPRRGQRLCLRLHSACCASSFVPCLCE